ncbi:putrescine oxidase [Curtobacterium luteum]|uniref:Putrescine oxidase n=1 Tax=Curtobacterium luteum TaxID=33881 RepID=A0A8H9KZ25_9MICO|nr:MULTISPECIES: NAD(P)/FAD-dependent oxidoreductase [Curtobacterium]MBM7803377.1 putrescine oxidase [Curtobacterium luteum]NUU51595.1 FAD-dependent oxidoreductase [Curtobacterium luteum]GGL07600.1 putative putrescine oxidase [Curtobacterium luteum]
MTIEKDVVVIGAGVTGLIAANRLVAEGHTVAVLEARDRVGGRTWTNDIEGVTLEIGGQWVSPDQTALLETLVELGLETYDRYREGSSVYIDQHGSRTEYTGDIFPLPEATATEIERLVAVVDEYVAKVDPDRPWETPDAAALDELSFREWLRRLSDDRVATENVELFIAGAMLTKPAHTFSALQALLMAASAGSFSNLVDADFILDKRVVGGMQQVSERLAAKLGDDVHLNAPVRTLRWDDEGVVAIADGGVEVRARQALVAVPPPLYSRISYEPPLPRRQHQLHQHLSMGFVIKVHAVYDRPFWRGAGLSGTAFSPYELVHEAYDNSMHGSEQGTLVGFVSDQHADDVFALSAEDRKARVLDSLAHYYGDEARRPVVYYESDWGTEEWTRGAYAASFDLGGLVRYGADQRAAVGPLRFASSDLAGHGYQHVDGAVRIGREVAAEIVADLPQPAVR